MFMLIILCLLAALLLIPLFMFFFDKNRKGVVPLIIAMFGGAVASIMIGIILPIVLLQLLSGGGRLGFGDGIILMVLVPATMLLAIFIAMPVFYRKTKNAADNPETLFLYVVLPAIAGGLGTIYLSSLNL